MEIFSKVVFNLVGVKVKWIKQIINIERFGYINDFFIFSTLIILSYLTASIINKFQTICKF